MRAIDTQYEEIVLDYEGQEASYILFYALLKWRFMINAASQYYCNDVLYMPAHGLSPA